MPLGSNTILPESVSPETQDTEAQEASIADTLEPRDPSALRVSDEGLENQHRPPSTPAPAHLDIDELHECTFQELAEMATKFAIRFHPDKSRHHLVFDICRTLSERGCALTATAVVDINAQGSAFLRWQKYNFRPLPQDIQVPHYLERQHHLKIGIKVHARLRAPRDRERFLVADQID